MIYLDHAATSYHKPEVVAQAVYAALMGTGNSGRGVHGASLAASRTVYEARQRIATLFEVGDASRVIFTANATDSLNKAIQGLLEAGDHCISTQLEHNSVLRPLYAMQERGVTHTLVAPTPEGHITVAALEAAYTEATKAVVMTHASNVLGTINAIDVVGAWCKSKGILLIVDASQTAGIIPIAMQTMQIDVLCASGHKSLLGPQGTGVLCLAEGVVPRPILYGGTGVESFTQTMALPLPTGLEAGTLNTHGIAGLGASCDYIMTYGQDRLYAESQRLTARFLEGVKAIPRITLYGKAATEGRTPVVSLNIGDLDSGEVADELFERFGIATRAGAHCAPLVHRYFGTEAQGMVRFSFSHDNTIEEIDSAIAALRTIEEETRCV